MPVYVRNVLVALAFVPMLCVMFLFAAMRSPRMDAVTVHMPMGVRTTVAGVVMQQAGYGEKADPAIDRVIRLDPENDAAWSRRCYSPRGTAESGTAACRRAIALKPTPWLYKELALKMEKAKDLTGAEATMRIAQSKADTIDDDPPLFLRELGRLEMVNGKLAQALKDLTEAEHLDGRNAEYAKDDDGEAKDALETDRAYMIVLFDRMHQPEKSQAMCRKAMPDAKECGCGLDEKNALTCKGWPPAKKDDEDD